jgi:hypothetical protein
MRCNVAMAAGHIWLLFRPSFSRNSRHIQHILVDMSGRMFTSSGGKKNAGKIFHLYLEVNYVSLLLRISQNSQFLDSIIWSTIPNFAKLSISR